MIKDLFRMIGVLLATRLASDHVENGVLIPGRWTVTLKDDAVLNVTEHARWAMDVHDNSTTNIGNYTGVVRIIDHVGWQGYTGVFEDETVDVIRDHPDVLDVVANYWRTSEVPNNGSQKVASDYMRPVQGGLE